MTEEAQKKLRLMTFWLFGIVLIVCVALIAYAGLWLGANWGAAVEATWPFMLLTVVVAVAVYAFYRFWYLQRLTK